MSILSGTGKIYMVREPVCGRFGIHRLLAMLSSNSLNVHWNGIDEVTIVTFNKRKTICKILHIDQVRLPDSKIIDDFYTVTIPNGAMICALTSDLLDSIVIST